MLNPVTEAVMEPSVAAARAVVDRCPIDYTTKIMSNGVTKFHRILTTTEATTREYSRMCVLTRSMI
jgi:hypothetical protein